MNPVDPINPIDKVIKKSEEFMNKNSYSGHDYLHVSRVYNLAKQIGKEENADLLILEVAAIMHDLGRHDETLDPSKDHAIESAKYAKIILEECDFPKEKIDAVLYCIKTHRFSKGIIPNTKEAKILQDADKIDGLGAVGIMRVFSVGKEKNRLNYNPKDPFGKTRTELDEKKYNMDHFYTKLFKLKGLMHTSAGKRIAEKREDYMKKFIEELGLEISGEK
jgi:uncharacterized protein